MGMTYAATGDVYDGCWKAGKRDGQGQLKCTNGIVWAGEWVADNLADEPTYIQLFTTPLQPDAPAAVDAGGAGEMDGEPESEPEPEPEPEIVQPIPQLYPAVVTLSPGEALPPLIVTTVAKAALEVPVTADGED